jgi:hypothetical protein
MQNGSRYFDIDIARLERYECIINNVVGSGVWRKAERPRELGGK